MSVTGLNNDLLRTIVVRELGDYTHDMHPHEHAFMRSDGSVDGDALTTYAGLRSTEDPIETLFNLLPRTGTWDDLEATTVYSSLTSYIEDPRALPQAQQQPVTGTVGPRDFNGRDARVRVCWPSGIWRGDWA